MESPVEGCSTPDFVESECSINIPGINWNEKTPRTYGVTPLAIASIVDQRLVNIKGSRPAVGLVIGEEVARHLHGRNSNPASGIPIMDARTNRVYKQMSSLCIEGNGIPSRLARDSESWIGNGSDSKLSYSSRDSVTPQVPLKDFIVKSKSSISIQDEHNSSILHIRAKSSTPRVASSSVPRARVAVNNYLVSPETGRDSFPLKPPKSSQLKSASYISVKDGHKSNNPHESSGLRSLSIQGSSISPRVIPHSETELRIRRKTDRDSVISKFSVLESTTAIGVKDGPTDHFPTFGINLQTENNRLSCSRARSVHSETTSRSENLLPWDLTKIEKSDRVRRSSSAQSSILNRSEISPFPKRDFVESSEEKESRLLLHSIQESSTQVIPSLQVNPGSTVNRSSRGVKSRTRSNESSLKRDKKKERKSSKSPSKNRLSSNDTGGGSCRVANVQKKSPQAKDIPMTQCTRILKSYSSLAGAATTNSRIPIRTNTHKLVDADVIPKESTQKSSLQIAQNSAIDINSKKVRNVTGSEAKPANGKSSKKKNQEPPPKQAKNKEPKVLSALERRKAYEAKRKSEMEQALQIKRVENIAKKHGKEAKESKDCNINEIKADKKQFQARSIEMNDFNQEKESNGHVYHPIVAANVSDGFEGSQEMNESSGYRNGKAENIIDKKKFGSGNHEENGKKNDEKFGGENRKINSQEFYGKDKKNDTDREKAQAMWAQNVSENFAAKPSTVKLDGGDQDQDKSCEIPFLNLMTNDEVDGFYMDFENGVDDQLSGRGNPNSARSDEEFGHLSPPNPNVSRSCFCGYDSPSVQEFPDPTLKNLHTGNTENRDKAKKKINMLNRWKVGQGKRPPRVRSKTANAKKKATVNYVPEYGAIRVVALDTEKAYQGRASENRSGSSRALGYVPGYGPARGEPFQAIPEVTSGKVVLPPINSSRDCNFYGDAMESKKSRFKKSNVDVCEARARAKPFNTYVDEEASRRFERQYRRQY